ncbi:MAG: membrane protein insertase YidC [Chloroflexi bacterium]|nr:membrane protein insertase YidC [Chloroflexota bacterium]
MNPFDVFLPVWQPFVAILEAGLRELALLTGSGGMAIILFTIFLKLILLPLSLMQTKSMKAMQAIGPELAEIKKKYPKDRERLAQEQMRLYKENGVNPAAGCLPMIPMMVVLIGLYQALNQLAHSDLPTDQAFRDSFLWIPNLNQPDIVGHIAGIAIPGLLPILMLVTQLAYGRMTPMSGSPDDSQQQMMQRMTTYFMPFMLFFFSFNFPAGLVVYWVISNIFEVVRMGATVSWDPLKPAAIMSSVGGLTALSSPFARDTSAPAPRRKISDDESDSNSVNPPPGRPPGGSRKKKGKRGGKR